MVNFRRLSPYEITFYGNLPACEAVDTYLNAELSATVDAAMYRGTTGATLGGLGEDGTLLFAGAISYSDTVEVADVADAYDRAKGGNQVDDLKDRSNECFAEPDRSGFEADHSDYSRFESVPSM